MSNLNFCHVLYVTYVNVKSDRILFKTMSFLSVLLDAPDTALIERAAGKRVDPETGG